MLLCLFFWQLPSRQARSTRTPVTNYVTSSFEALPKDAVAIASWSKFAALIYYQEAYDLRQDLTIVERVGEPRHYAFGAVANWMDYAASLPETVPVFIDRFVRGGPRMHLVRSLDENWHQITVDPIDE
jgi:hypothetical protein